MCGYTVISFAYADASVRETSEKKNHIMHVNVRIAITFTCAFSAYRAGQNVWKCRYKWQQVSFITQGIQSTTSHCSAMMHVCGNRLSNISVLHSQQFSEYIYYYIRVFRFYTTRIWVRAIDIIDNPCKIAESSWILYICCRWTRCRIFYDNMESLSW